MTDRALGASQARCCKAGRSEFSDDGGPAPTLEPVWTPLAVAVAALSLVLSGWAGWRTLRNRPVILRQLLFAGVIEALLLVEVVVAVVRSVLTRATWVSDHFRAG